MFVSIHFSHCGTRVYRLRLCRWVVLAAEAGRAVLRTAERNYGGAAGCEEAFGPCGTSNSFQGDEIAMALMQRERQKELMVVQLDVKKLLDHVEHPTTVKTMRLRWL